MMKGMRMIEVTAMAMLQHIELLSSGQYTYQASWLSMFVMQLQQYSLLHSRHLTVYLSFINLEVVSIFSTFLDLHSGHCRTLALQQMSQSLHFLLFSSMTRASCRSSNSYITLY